MSHIQIYLQTCIKFEIYNFQAYELQKTCFIISRFVYHIQNVGQTIYVAGPLFLRMVLAVILAVVVYSKQL